MVGYRYRTNVTWESGSNLLVLNCNERLSCLPTVHYIATIVKQDVNVRSVSSEITINVATGVYLEWLFEGGLEIVSAKLHTYYLPLMQQSC